MQRVLFRDDTNQMIGGVCSGLATYLNMDVSLLRVLTALALIFTSGGVFIAYIVFWLVLPTKTQLIREGKIVTEKEPFKRKGRHNKKDEYSFDPDEFEL
ncbi:MAG: PspC domain-containing protein [Candidatus Izemoplasmataceae bacterium]